MKNLQVSETIFATDRIVIPMADVQHIEKYEYGCLIVTSHTKWNFEHDCWENNIALNVEETEKFLKAYCYYRYELDRKLREKNK